MKESLNNMYGEISLQKGKRDHDAFNIECGESESISEHEDPEKKIDD